MDFDMFQETLYRKLLETVHEDGKGEITFMPVRKYNQTLHAMTYTPNGSRAGAIFYAEPFYEQFRNGSSIDELAEGIYSMIQEHIKNTIPEVLKAVDELNDLSRVIPVFIAREGNEEFLAKLAHVPFENLEIIFKYQIPEINATADLTKKNLDSLGMSASQLLETVKNNPIFKDTTKILPLKEIVKRMDPEFAELLDMMPGPRMYIVTNQEETWGASVILNEDLMEQLSKEVEDDLYIIPSSIDECIVVPKCDSSLEMIEAMIPEINEELLEPQQRLSDSPYLYDSRERSIKQITEERKMSLIQEPVERQR